MAGQDEDFTPEEQLEATGGSGQQAATTTPYVPDQGVSDVLSAVQSRNAGPSPSVADLRNYNPYTNRIESEAYQHHGNGTGALPESTYFPAAGNNINKGSYSGSQVGSIPIYAPSALVPFGLYDARERALQDAAMQKMKSINDFQDRFKAPVTKNAAFQGKLNEEYYSGLQKHISDAKKEYGDNWAQALEHDPTFNKWNQDMGAIKQQEDQIAEHAAHIQKDIEEGKEVSPETRQSLGEAFDSMHRALSTPLQADGNFHSKFVKSVAYRDSDALINQALSKITPSETETGPAIYDSNGHEIMQSKKHEGVSDERLRVEAKQLARINPVRTEDEYFNTLRAKSGTKDDVKYSDVTKSDKSGRDETHDFNNVKADPQDINISINGAEGGTPTNTTVQGNHVMAFKKPIKVQLSTNSRTVSPEGAGQIPEIGNKEVEFGDIAIMPVLKTDGKRFTVLQKGWETDPKYKDIIKNKQFEYKAMAAGTYKHETPNDDPNKKGVMEEKTVYVPAEDVQNALEKTDAQGKYKSGIPVQKYAEEAKKQTEQAHKVLNPEPVHKAAVPVNAGTKVEGKTVAKKFVNAAKTKTKVVYTDGTSEILDGQH